VELRGVLLHGWQRGDRCDKGRQLRCQPFDGFASVDHGRMENGRGWNHVPV
jgi:hypothetical protein